MPIELIIKIGAGALFGGIICVAILSLIHRRVLRLTERRLESAFENSTAQIRADKDLLQTILLHARAQISAINRLSSELDALRIELDSVKTKVHSTYSAPPDEHVSLVPLAPTPNRVSQKSGLSLKGGSSQPDGDTRQEDTWARDASPSDAGESELQALLALPEKDLIAEIKRQAAGQEKKSSR